jgi:hypothetical protein
MAPVTREQALAIMATLMTKARWEEIDFNSADLQSQIIRNPEAGKHFTAFLKNGGRVIVGEPKVIPIDRSKPFNPAKFIGEGWTIEEQDERSLALAEIDLTSIQFEHMLSQGETWIMGEDKLRRPKDAGHIRLDAKVFQTLWENQHLIPERFKEKKNGNTTVISFDGTVLRNLDDYHYVLYFYWNDNRWHWSFRWLYSERPTNYLSAVLKC